MRKKELLILLLTVFFQLSGCKESFEPKGTYNEKVVVFAILTTLSDTQYIRIYKTYDPPAYNPLEYTTDNSLTGGLVSVTDGSVTYPFRDTTIVRADKSRYQTDIRAYVAHPFMVKPGTSYTLNIQTEPGKAIQTQLSVPQAATMFVGSTAALRDPLVFSDDVIDLNSGITPLTRGFKVHAYVGYELMVDSIWIPKREELPVAVSDVIDCNNFVPTYHRLQRRKPGQPEQTLFSVLSYLTIVKKIWNTNPPTDVRLKHVVFELTQFDRNLYDYYNIASGFRDAFSIRTDEPDYSNIPGGLGIFGAMARQSITVAIPETLGMSLGCQ